MDKSPLSWLIIVHSILSMSSLLVIFYLILPELPNIIAVLGFWLILTILPLYFLVYISIGPLFRNKDTITEAGKIDVLTGAFILIPLIWTSTMKELLTWDGFLLLVIGILLITLGISLVHSQDEQVIPEITDDPVKTTWWPWGPDGL